MKLKYTVITNRKNGQKEATSVLYEKSPLVIGRGGSADIIVNNRAVALEHVCFVFSNNQVVLENISGRADVFVNGALTDQVVLNDGDLVKCADISLRIVLGQGLIECIYEKVNDLEESPELKAQDAAQRLTLSNHFPSPWRISLIVGAIIFVVYFIMPLVTSNRDSWSSGQISSNHKMIEQNCAACHSSPFISVKDEQCLQCHAMSDHASVLPKLVKHEPSLEISCASCHAEHRHNRKLTDKESGLCAECHSNISKIYPETKAPNVKSFRTHQEFSVALRTSEDTFRKFTLSDAENLKDPTPIKLNHKVHLTPDLRGPDGSMTLNCYDCHRLTDNHKAFKPISFERDCKSCHPLTFDERFADREVPHAEPDVVYSHLYAEYAQFALGGSVSKAVESDQSSSRQKPGGTVERSGTKAVEFARASIVREARSAEKELFGKTACQLCHIVTALEGIDVSSNQSEYGVLKPHIPETWMPAAHFSHEAHEAVQCESCHKNLKHTVRESERTEDILLPVLADCQNCHSADKSKNHVQSDCVMCHSYHDSVSVGFEQKRVISEIVNKFK